MSIHCLFTSLLLFLFLSLSSPTVAQQIRFNEAQSSNTQFFDEDGDPPDWFELYNEGNSTTSLNGWTITDDIAQPDKWTLPNLTLEADNHVLIWASGKNRPVGGVPRTLISEGDICRYTTVTGAINGDWTSLSFDDSGWSQGSTGIGYGDGDDATTIPNGTRSVFLRKAFTIADVGALQELILHVDYDDAFVAYLNGKEVARANIEGTPPAYDATANTDHEAQIYGGGTPDPFVLAHPAELLQNGDNVFCVQAHNVSPNSSDFTIIPFLTAIYNAPTSEGVTPPDVLQFGDQSLHTNFKLSSSGETLYLFDATGSMVDSLVIGPLLPDVSYGVSANNLDLVFFDTPTPGLPNGGDEFIGIQEAAIEFSHPGGPTGPLSLTLSGIAAPAMIRYTLDATVPDENSPIYSSPISITSNSVVRARVFQQGFIPSSTQSRTYLVNVSHDLPVISLVTEPDNFFDDDDGIYVLGDDYEMDFPHFGANFWEDWERPIHFSLYETSGSSAISFDGGTKIFGGWSRGNEQRSLSIFARNEYGVGEINYPLFPDQHYDTYQAIVLRNAGNDWLNSNMRDATLTGLMKNSGLDFQAYRPAATYLNGEYWGLYNMREKINEHFLASKHGLNPDHIDLLEMAGTAIHGDNQEYLNLMNFVVTNNLALTSNYQVVKDQIDIENYIIYQVAQIYFDNTDWPGNNIKYWKAKNGKWRWILFDTDFGFGVWNTFNYFNNTLQFTLEPNGPGWPNPPWSTELFRNLISNLEFRNEFINRFADELNSRLLPERVCEHIDTLKANISSEINTHYIRWGGSLSYWNEQVNNMKTFAENRPNNVKNHIRQKFGLAAFHKLNINNNDPSQGYVKVNRLTIKENNWAGDYFQDVPIKVRAIPEPGFAFSHWSGGSTSTNAELTINMTSVLTLIPHFILNPATELPIVINEINYNSNDDFNTGDWIELHNPNPYFIDLSGWLLKDDNDDHQFIFPQGAIMEGGEYWVLVNDLIKFKTFYPNMENIKGEFNFGLSSNGDAVRLFGPNNLLQDVVNYSPNNPWPESANGSGSTLELIHPALDNSLPENWANVHVHGSPGESNFDITGNTTNVVLENLNYYPNPFSDQINITFSLSQPSFINAALYDMSGVLVHTFLNEQLISGDHFLKQDLGFLNSGIYLLVFKENKKGAFVAKWIKL